MHDLSEKKIIHIDLDAFFAAVEQRDNPSLKGQPVVIGGAPDKRGVVSTASYEARKFGIRSAMPTRKALLLCPHAIFLKPNFQKYTTASKKIKKIFYEITDLVEPLSLDEAYLDVTKNKLKEPIAKTIAIYIKSRIKGETGLTASAGVAPLKFLAKIASAMNKPDGLTVIPPSHVQAFIDNLPVEKLWSVGPQSKKKLHQFGIFLTKDIKSFGLTKMEKIFGQHGYFLYQLSIGNDPRPVTPAQEAKSRGSEHTFEKDTLNYEVLQKKLIEQAGEISEELRKNSKKGKTITLKIRYNDFSTITRSHTLLTQTDDAEIILKQSLNLLENQTEAGSRPIRLIGISISKFESENEDLQLKFPFLHS